MSKLNEQQEKAFADILLKVPSVGPETAALLLGTYDGLMNQKAHALKTNVDKVVIGQVEEYANSLWTVMGYLATHQKAVIDKFARLIKR